MNMKEVNEIQSQIGQLQAKIKDARARLEQAGLRALGLRIGDRIKTRRGVVEVVGCEIVSSLDPRPVGYKIKKDGSVGHQSAGYIDEWEKVE